MTTKAIIILTLSILFILVPVSAKEWRGIRPLHSTQADVEQKLGKSTDASRRLATYQTAESAVTVMFASGPPCGLKSENEWRVPEGTVLSITVSPKTIILFSTLRIDESKYQKLSDPHMLNRVEYWNKVEGESISVVNGEVSSFTYFAEAKDFYLHCPGARPPEPPTRESYTLLDTYGNLRFRDEKARLDNFAIALQQRPGSRGYIMGYPASRVSVWNTLARLERARTYLVNVRGFEAKRLVRIRGGLRKQFTVELFIVPTGAVAPSPLPPAGSSNKQSR